MIKIFKNKKFVLLISIPLFLIVGFFCFRGQILKNPINVNAAVCPATGGTVTQADGYCIHTFTSSGTFTPNTITSVEALVVAGGGGGGSDLGGGGGGGGVIYNANFSTTVNNIASCRAILDAGASTGSGLYTIDPDGTGGNAPFQVYCDMTTDGGGWTRIAKFGTAYNIVGSTYTTGFGTASASEYAHQCSLFNALGLTDATMRLNMGQVKDYYKPTSSYSICQMIAESPGTHFQWASTYNGTFQTPSYYSAHLGGSAVSWPASIDGRNYLGFWGGGGTTNSGCCHNTSTLYGGSADTAAWSRAFDMYIREPSKANVTVTVGAGGAGGQQVRQSTSLGTNGSNSSFGILTAIGGGGGGSYWASNSTYDVGKAGGSAGGNGAKDSTVGATVGLGTAGQGNNGGTSGYSPGYPGGGGGGAGGVGGNSGATTGGGAGGIGFQSLISGTATYYGGGGGGSNYSASNANTSGGAGGLGGGGNGGYNVNAGGTSVGANGVANTGGGGGGGSWTGSTPSLGGNGGSGIVIIRYPAVNPISVITTIDGLYTVKKYVGVGSMTWTAPTGVTAIDYLIVAGGGGGGSDLGGGGGGGGVLYGSNYTVNSNPYTITVGAGGAGGQQVRQSNSLGINGGNSSLGTLTAIGGGGGGSYWASNSTYDVGKAGGSAGGNGAKDSTVGTTVGLGTAGQGNNGGTSGYNPGYPGGGGGGAGGVGGNSGATTGGGAGGIGFQSSISGTATYYGGGGGGSNYSASNANTSGGAGGLGGGGNGGYNFNAGGTSVGANGANNTGGGGGGGSWAGGNPSIGGNGGSGIVIIRYLTSTPISFTYYKPITINNTSNTSTLTGYQVLVTVDTSSLIAASKMKSDCGDIRFTDVSAAYNSGTWTNNFPYWIESGCNTSTTKIWVKVNSIAASSNKTIYMYYGNTSAVGISNGDNVFEFFDDFNGINLDTAKWLTKSGTVTVSGGEAKLQSTVWMYTNNFYPYNRAMRAKVKSAYFANSSYNLQCNFNNVDTDTPAYSGSFAIFSHPSASINGKYSNYNGTHYASDITGWTAGAYHTLDIARAGTTAAKNYVDNANEVINTTGITTEDHRLYLYSSINDGVIVDWILVRNYSSIDPTTTVGAELSSEYNSTPSTSSDLTCRLTSGACSGTNEVSVFKLYDPAGNHAELSSQSNYSYKVCCAGEGLSNSCSATYKDTVLRLSAITNAHVEKDTSSGYTGNEVCLSSATNPITCNYSNTTCSALGTNYVCLASISGDTNAHVGECATYTTKVCCDASVVVDPCTAKVASNKFISAKDADIQLCSGADTTNPADPCYSVCWKGTGAPVITNPNWVCGVCHDSSNNAVACTADNSTFSWTMPSGYTTPTDYTLISSTTLTSPNPIVRFVNQDSTRRITLNTSNYSTTCSSSTTVQLLPKWKEITPFK